MKVVQMRFPGSRKLHTYEVEAFDVSLNEILVVEGERGSRLGSVASEATDIEWKRSNPPLKVIRKAKDDDLKKAQEYKAREPEAAQICVEAIAEHHLPMKLVKAEYLFDGTKVIFYFTAEGRVDFRELVRRLAQRLRTRIEMYQIGVRDEAKILGGLGVCGRIFCCAQWLSGFTPVSIRMAKDQGLSLNPTKVSGGCGRLLCCLSYEHETYAEFRRGLPKIGKRAQTPKGIGRVSRYDIFSGRLFVTLEDGKEEGFMPEEVTTPPPVTNTPSPKAGANVKGPEGGK